MRVAIVAESFLPTVNGVTTSVCRVLDCLRDLGHDAVVVAPHPAPPSYAGFAVHTVATVPLRQFPVGLPTAETEQVLRDFDPDIVHVASPFVVGARGLAAANRLGLPTVAVYQTDVPAYLRRHSPGRGGRVAERAAWTWVRRVHEMADLTLAPSSAAEADLRAHGIPRVRRWGRGVDTGAFSPRHRLGEAARQLRRQVAPHGEVVVGYVGRLAPEKELHRLTDVANLPGTTLLLVGDGPSRQQLEQQLPAATFLGQRCGQDLVDAYAAMDLFVHTGTTETFGQTLQEAAASGLPVVAPAQGGPLDLVDPGRTGLLFDPRQEGGLRDAVLSLTQGPGAAEHRRALGQQGHALTLARSWPRVVDQLVDHYGAVLAARAVAA